MSWTPTISTKENTDTKIGGGPVNNIFRYLKRINLGLVNNELEPEITTPTHFIGRSLRLSDNDEDASVIHDTSNLDLDADAHQYVRYPIITNVESGEKRDVFTMDVTQATLKKKTLPLTGTDRNILSDPAANATHLAAFNASGELEKKLFSSVAVNPHTHPPKELTRYATSGKYAGSSEMGLTAVDGVLKGLTSLGSQGATNINLIGKYHIWNTLGGVVNDAAGVVKLGGSTTLRYFNPLLRFAFLFAPNPSSNRRMFKGWTPQGLLATNSDTVPLSSGQHGFIFGHGAGDTQFYIYHNDATGVCVKDPTGISLPTAVTDYILEIQANDSIPNFVWTLWNVTSLGDKGTVAGTGTITTRIPTQLIHLYMQDLVVASDTSIQPNNINSIEVFI